MYTVIRAFHDLQDGKATKAGMIYHCYEVGDVYPREGLKPSPERIEELSGPHNAQGCPLIATDAAAEATAKLEAAAMLKIIKGKKIDARSLSTWKASARRNSARISWRPLRWRSLSNGTVPGFGKIDVDTWTKGGVNR